MRRVMAILMPFTVIITALVIVVIVRSGHSAQPAVPEPSATSQGPVGQCVKAVQKVLVRYGDDSKTSDSPAWILTNERDSMTDVQYEAYSTVSTDYSQMVNPYLQNMPVQDAVSNVLPTVRQICSRAS